MHFSNRSAVIDFLDPHHPRNTKRYTLFTFTLSFFKLYQCTCHIKSSFFALVLPMRSVTGSHYGKNTNPLSFSAPSSTDRSDNVAGYSNKTYDKGQPGRFSQPKLPVVCSPCGTMYTYFDGTMYSVQYRHTSPCFVVKCHTYSAHMVQNIVPNQCAGMLSTYVHKIISCRQGRMTSPLREPRVRE